MKLKLTVESIGTKGIKDISVREIDKRQIVIGRGPECDIRLDSRYVSLRHCLLYDQNGDLILEDRGTLSGTLVNNAPITRTTLKTGDTILVGDHQLKVIQASSPFELFLSIDRSQGRDLKQLIQNDLETLDVSKLFRYARPASLALFGIIILAGILWPLLDHSKAMWNPGELSSAHRILENSCASCHESNFKIVSDQKCLSCHQLTIHGESKPHEAPRCVDCHFEHRGPQGLSIVAVGECENCHQIESFDKHPAFKMKADEGKLRFNHHLHLSKPLPSKENKIELVCVDCHRAGSDREKMSAITYKENCRSCHSLEFDEGFAGLEVPHGSPEEVFNFLLRTYQTKGIPSKPAVSTRIPGQAERTAVKPSTPNEAARAAEAYLFKEGPCQVCHQVSAVSKSNQGARFQIQKVELETEWMLKAIPIHSSHESYSCISCHSKTLDSQDSKDILIPSVTECQTCHTGGASKTLVPSPCALCHSYHRSIKLSPDKQRRGHSQ